MVSCGSVTSMRVRRRGLVRRRRAVRAGSVVSLCASLALHGSVFVLCMTSPAVQYGDGGSASEDTFVGTVSIAGWAHVLGAPVSAVETPCAVLPPPEANPIQAARELPEERPQEPADLSASEEHAQVAAVPEPREPAASRGAQTADASPDAAASVCPPADPTPNPIVPAADAPEPPVVAPPETAIARAEVSPHAATAASSAIGAERAAETPQGAPDGGDALGQAGTPGEDRVRRGERGDVRREYIGRVVRKIHAAKRYPAGARLRNVEGQAEVTLAIAAHGGVLEVRLSTASGFRALDEEAVAMVRRAAPFEPIPEELGLESLRLIVPVRFRIHP